MRQGLILYNILVSLQRDGHRNSLAFTSKLYVIISNAGVFSMIFSSSSTCYFDFRFSNFESASK